MNDTPVFGRANVVCRPPSQRRRWFTRSTGSRRGTPAGESRREQEGGKGRTVRREVQGAFGSRSTLTTSRPRKSNGPIRSFPFRDRFWPARNGGLPNDRRNASAARPAPANPQTRTRPPRLPRGGSPAGGATPPTRPPRRGQEARPLEREELNFRLTFQEAGP